MAARVIIVRPRKYTYGRINYEEKLRKKKKNIQPQLDGIAQIPLNRRSSLRSTASAVGVSLTILHRRLKDGDLRKHNSIIKPTLSQQHRLRRVDFCKSFLCFLDRRKFYDMNDVIHVDKKWFYLTKVKRKYYLGNDEPNPHPTLRSKRFITKVMFLTDSPERRRSRIVWGWRGRLLLCEVS